MDGPPSDGVSLLIVTGPPGSGKTTVASAVSVRLQEAAEPHAMVDLDALGWSYPRPEGDPFHADLRLTNLAAVWRNHRAAGARRLIVATVVESPDEVARIGRAVGSPDPALVRLHADAGERARRLARREHGSELTRHLARAIEVERALDTAGWVPPAVDTTGRDPMDIADDVLRSAGWPGAHLPERRSPGLEVEDAHAAVEVLAVSGPAGVGKTSVAFEVSLLLQRRDLPHALIDTDELDRLVPTPVDQEALNEQALAAVWEGFARRGCRRLILAGVWLHRPSELAWIARAIPGARFTPVMLVASEAAIEERVRRREIGSGADAQLERSLRYARSMDGESHGAFRVTTDGVTVSELARRIVERWVAADE